MNAYCLLLHRKEIEYLQRKRTIYYIYSKKKKVGKTATKGHKKRGLKNSPLITRKRYAYSAGCSLTVSSAVVSVSLLARLAM